MFVSKEKAQQRLSTCNSCENFIPMISMCSICHCIMPLKAKLADVSCPINKWSRVSEKEWISEDPDSPCCPPPNTPVVFIPPGNHE